MDAVLGLQQMDEVVAVLEIDGIMAHHVQRDGLCKRLGIGHKHFELAGPKVVQNLTTLVKPSGCESG